jgi:hypothetical protein
MSVLQTDCEIRQDMSYARAHIERKLSEANLELHPFPHIVIENFFPDDVFTKLLEYNPFRKNAGEAWSSREASADVTSKTPYYARKQINFHRNQVFNAPPDQLDFWAGIKRLFLEETWFETAVLHKYTDYFQLRFGDLVMEPDFVQLFTKELFLQRHEPGYYIGPHTDVPARVFTCIFALADREGFEEYGTELLRPKDRLDRCWGNDHYPPEDFDVVKVAPYKPNNFLLFFKSRQSFHAVKAITDAVPNQRYGMQFQFYEPSGGLLHDLSAPDLMKVIRTNAAAKSLRGRVKQVAKTLLNK